MWAAWCLHCEIRRSSAHDPQPGVLPDWLRARSSPQGLATMPFKALSWFSRKAGLPLLRRQLEGAIARAFLSPSAPLEHRESLPFSLSFTAWLEARVLCPDTLPAETYMLGVLLCAIWASLRWGDLLWVPPARLHFQAPSAALVGICIRTKTTKSGMPWGIYSPGLLGFRRVLLDDPLVVSCQASSCGHQCLAPTPRHRFLARHPFCRRRSPGHCQAAVPGPSMRSAVDPQSPLPPLESAQLGADAFCV
ncbi:unnamed protein product [Symbiodinium natans]|uniref:Uncharacterized protein n=1 Tax=Symbiodinium natans TaxID=878477 RepID=A0A812I110_9DINO|nr:unnamed protein product [Symbiodinium natans]CAE7244216.1 unnamed protein product [Symbiodinium natans]